MININYQPLINGVYLFQTFQGITGELNRIHVQRYELLFDIYVYGFLPM
jgi:hypothetical protein